MASKATVFRTKTTVHANIHIDVILQAELPLVFQLPDQHSAQSRCTVGMPWRICRKLCSGFFAPHPVLHHIPGREESETLPEQAIFPRDTGWKKYPPHLPLAWRQFLGRSIELSPALNILNIGLDKVPEGDP